MADERLRLASLSVLGGSLHGAHYEPADVVGEILVGSDPDCHLVLDRPAISPIHARVWSELGQARIHDTHAPRGVYVNTERVETEAVLRDGDVLWLGPPDDADSVCVRFQFEPWEEVLPASVVGAASEEPVPVEPFEAPSLAPAPVSLLEADPSDPFFVGSDELAASQPGPSPAPGEPAPSPMAPAEPPGPTPAPSPTPPPAPSPGPAPDAGADDFFIAEEGAPVAPAAVQPPAPPPGRPTAPSPAASRPAAPASGPQPAQRPAQPKPATAAPAPKPGTPAVAPTPAASRPAAPPAAPRSAAPTGAGRPAGPTPGRPSLAAPQPPRRPDQTIAADSAVEPPRRPPAAPRSAVASARSPQPGPRPTPIARRPGGAARPAAAKAGGPSRSFRGLVMGLVALGVVAAAAVAGYRYFGDAVEITGVEPARMRVAQRAVISGRGFAPDAAGCIVLFDTLPAKVVSSSPTRIEVEVPAVVSEAGSERRVEVVVKRGMRSSPRMTVLVVQGPRLHGLSTPAALPGDEVELAGAGWGIGATVRFGNAQAQVVQTDATRIRAVVPEAVGPVGSSAPVVVAVGGVESNAAPFLVGRLPVVSSATPPSAAPGDVVELAGLGFDKDPLRNDVRVAGLPALVVSASETLVRLVVPRVGAGEPARSVELRVPGSANVGAATLQVGPPSDPIELGFVAEPFSAVPGRPHAVLATGLGPAFVLAAAGGESAAERALAAQRRLNQALPALRSTLGLNVEARGFEGASVLYLAGRSDALLEVAEEDAAAYNEDWTGLRGRGGPVTRPRLARWWEAVARDLVLLLLRAERPRFAAELAPEGKVFGQVFDAARKTGAAGIPLGLADQGRPPLREALRLAALRVPAAVVAPSVSVPAAVAPGLPAPAATATTPSPSAPPRLQLDGTFRGSETEAGERRYLTVTFRHGEGSISYEGGITLTMPLLSVEQRGRDEARFSVRIRGGMRYYTGKWDGERLRGSITTDAAGRTVIASFELRR